MANGIRTGDPSGFNKGRRSKFRWGSRVRHTPEEGQRIYQPKRCGNNNKDEGNSPKTVNDKITTWNISTQDTKAFQRTNYNNLQLTNHWQLDTL